MCEMLFNHNPFIYTAVTSENLSLKAYYLYTLCLIKRSLTFFTGRIDESVVMSYVGSDY